MALSEALNGSFKYTSWNDSFEITDTFPWTAFQDKIITDIIVDSNSIQIFCEDHGFTLVIWGHDYRREDEMDPTSCTAEPEGCCFEHSGCGYEKCLEHYPLQKLTFECETNRLLNSTIIGLHHDSYDPYYHEFSLIVNAATGECRIPFEVCNTTPEHLMTVYLSVDY